MKKLISILVLILVFLCWPLKTSAYASNTVAAPAVANSAAPWWWPWGKKEVKPATKEQIEDAIQKCLKDTGVPNTKQKQAKFLACLRTEITGAIGENNRELFVCTLYSLFENGNVNTPSSLCQHFPGCMPCDTPEECGVAGGYTECCAFKWGWCMYEKRGAKTACDIDKAKCLQKGREDNE